MCDNFVADLNGRGNADDVELFEVERSTTDKEQAVTVKRCFYRDTIARQSDGAADPELTSATFCAGCRAHFTAFDEHDVGVRNVDYGPTLAEGGAACRFVLERKPR